MTNRRIAVIVIIAVWCSTAAADVSQPWFTVESAPGGGISLFPVTPAPWATEVGENAFRIAPDIHSGRYPGAGVRWVVREVGSRAELRVHVVDFPPHYMEGSPILSLVANGSIVASVRIWTDSYSETTEASVSNVAASGSAARWLGIVLDWPRAAILTSTDGQQWDLIVESLLSFGGPYHVAFGIYDCIGGAPITPVNYDNVALGFEPVATEGSSWGRVKSLFR